MKQKAYQKTTSLITKLVKKSCPKNINALRTAFDIIRQNQIHPQEININTYISNWIYELEKCGKSDKIQLLKKNIEQIFLHSSFSNSLFFLLELLRNKKDSKLTSDGSNLIAINNEEFQSIISTPQKCVFSSTYWRSTLPYDFIFLLQGIATDDFPYSSAKKSFYIRDKLNPLLLYLFSRCSQIGCMFKLIDNWIKESNGLIRQLASSYLKELMRKHLNYVSSIRQTYSSLSITEFESLLSSNQIEQLSAAAIICNTVNDLDGSNLYNNFCKISLHGDPTISSMAMILKEKTFSAYDFAIREWITKGTLNDPYQEFFISSNENIDSCSQWWTDRFQTKKESIPINLSQSIVETIFTAGKALNFLRKWDTPVELKLNSSLKLEDFVQEASSKANKELLNCIILKYNLGKTLNDILDYMLLSRGDFASSFIENDSGSISYRLTSIIQQFASYPVKGLDIGLSNNKWQFSYSCFPPLSAIFGPEELRIYSSVSQLMISLKATHSRILKSIRNLHKIDRVRISYVIKEKKKADVKNFQADSIEHAFFYKSMHLINIISDFFHFHVISQLSYKLQSKLKNPFSFDELLEAHKKFTHGLMRGCFLSQSGKDCHLALESLLSTITNCIQANEWNQEIMNDFHDHIRQFVEVLNNNEVGGKILANPIRNIFPYIFSK